MEPEDILKVFDRRYKLKKITNICISILIVIFGITSFWYGTTFESMPTIFRFMTVDATVFTTLGAIAFIIVNLNEMIFSTELTVKFIFFVRLSSAVTEMVILIAVITSQLPFFSEHFKVFERYDYLAMHLIIPILVTASFVHNDSPIGKLRPLERWNGTMFVTFYAVIIWILILTKTITGDLIPYYFLDVWKTPWYFLLFVFVFIYGVAYLMGWLLSEWNRKVSWMWFTDIACESRHSSGRQ